MRVLGGDAAAIPAAPAQAPPVPPSISESRVGEAALAGASPRPAETWRGGLPASCTEPAAMSLGTAGRKAGACAEPTCAGDGYLTARGEVAVLAGSAAGAGAGGLVERAERICTYERRPAEEAAGSWTVLGGDATLRCALAADAVPRGAAAGVAAIAGEVTEGTVTGAAGAATAPALVEVAKAAAVAAGGETAAAAGGPAVAVVAAAAAAATMTAAVEIDIGG